MGLFDSDASNNGKPVFYGQIKTKGLPAPLIQLVSKDTGETKTVNAIDGNITGIQYTENEYEGNKIKGYRITFDAPDGVALFSLGFTSLARSIYNSLLSLKSGENVKISLYKNKRGYDAVSVTQGGEKVAWALDMKDPNLTPEIVKDEKGAEVLIDGKKIIKWEKVINFLVSEMDKKFVGTGFKFATPTAGVAATHEATPATTLDELIEDTDMPEPPFGK